MMHNMMSAVVEAFHTAVRPARRWAAHASAACLVGALAMAGHANAADLSKVATVPGTTLEVMTFNMEHHDKPQELESIARHLKSDLPQVPDFIVCQEVVFGRHGTKEAPEDNTAAVLARHLGYYCKGTKRTSDHEGIAIISKYPFDFYDSVNLKNQTLRVLLGFRRVSVMGEFTVPGVGKVRVADTHLTNWEFEGHVRNGQIAETLEWVAQREQANPAVVTFFGGDFNAKINWHEMGQITDPASNGGLPYVNDNGTEYTQGMHGHPSKRIDFVFTATARQVSSGLKFVKEQLMWKSGLLTKDGDHFYPSDHLAVVHTYAVDSAVLATFGKPAAPTAARVRTADVRD